MAEPKLDRRLKNGAGWFVQTVGGAWLPAVCRHVHTRSWVLCSRGRVELPAEYVVASVYVPKVEHG